MRLRTLILAATVVAGLSSAANGAVTTYTSRAAYLAALSGNPITTVDFNSFTSDDFAPVDVGPFTITAVGSFASDNGVEAYDPGGNDVQVSGGQDRNIDGTSYYSGDVQQTLVTFSFDAPYVAFGTDYISFGADDGVTLNGEFFAFPAANDATPLFFGLISDTAFSALVFGGSDGAFGFDNIALASAAVPEPATWAMMIAGFGLVGSAMRRKARSCVRYA